MSHALKVRLTMIEILLATALAASSLPAFAAETHKFDVPIEDSAAAIRDFASQAHVQILVAGENVKDKHLHAVSGTYSTDQGLHVLLADSGLSPKYVGDRSIALIASGGPDDTQTAGSSPPSQAPDGSQSGQLRLAQVDQQSPPKSYGNQTTEEEKSKQSKSEQLTEVVVTGTHIAGANPATPLITIGHTEIEQSGYSDVGEVLRALPQNFSGGQNPGVIGAFGNQNGISASSPSSANLRGLGADSTLTLVDGHRLAYDGSLNGVDLSIVPLAAVDRIEILPDGASAVYGSDAVAGVVNVILKKDFEGAETSARFGDSTQGGGYQQQYSLLGGHDWGTGNALVTYEYNRSDPLFASDRSFSSTSTAPQSLLPLLERNSVFAAFHQELTSSISVFGEGLYTSRTSDLVVNSFGTASPSHTDVKQYGIVSGANVSLPADWHLSVEGTFSRDRDVSYGQDIDDASGTVLDSSLNTTQNELWSVEGHAGGPLFTLPSGPVALATGAGYRRESYTTNVPTDASRNIRFGYAEVQVPFVEPSSTRLGLNSLDLNAATRYEDYNDFGAKTTSKVGLVYVPQQDLRIHGTWSQSFRAPELEDVYGGQTVILAPATILGGTGDALIARNANVNLRPETATARTIGLDFVPTWRPTLKITTTYYNIDYTNRIVQPISNLVGSLANPIYAPFVTLNPSAAQQTNLLIPGTTFENLTGAPYTPSSVAYILDDRFQNATSQKIHGVDLTARDSWDIATGKLTVAANASWLTIRQRLLTTLPETTLSGTIFNPPTFKARGSATWQQGPWSFTAIANYIDGLTDTSTTPGVPISSWTTFDAQIAFTLPSNAGNRFLSGWQLSLSVQNLFDRDPPFVASTSTFYPGMGYDSTNASPLGRFISGYISKKW